jgi:hypothetical protein
MGVFAALLLLVPGQVRAATFTYDLTFMNFFAPFGSGVATFDDTPVGPGSSYAGSTQYNFTSFVGSGIAGNWTESHFDYNATTGDNNWSFSTDLGWMGGSFPNIGTGLTPVDALEQNFAYQASVQHLSWSRRGENVPDGSTTATLLSLGLLGVAGVRRFLWGR